MSVNFLRFNAMDYVGIPYKENSVNPDEGLDCYGIVRYVLNTERGLALPEKPPIAARWHRYVKLFKPPLPYPIKHDILMFAEIIPGIVNHIGIMISATDFVHSGSKFGGVVCEPINKYRYLITGLGRPHDH